MGKNDVTVRILGDAGGRGGLTGALKSAEGGLSKFGLGAGKAIAGVAAVGVAAVVGLAKIGSTFDAEFDKIRVGTGATGAALEGLKGEFGDVLSSVPTDAASAGTAIADLNTRLGLTGDVLQSSATQFLNLSRITGGEVSTQVEKATRAFGDWGIATEDQEAALDKLYRSSQASGQSFEDLSGQIVSFGAPLRNLGFGFEESAALLGQFEKTGVNTETVMAGLKAGIGKLAKAGEDVPSTFRRVVDEITAMGPGTEATGLAIELFGQRSGPDLADAIAGGKFELSDMLDAIENGTDTINAAAKDTESFGEKWQLIKNKVLVGLQPLASRVFDGIGVAMDRLSPYVDQITNGINLIVAGFSGASGSDSGPGRFGAVIREVADVIAANWPRVREILVETISTVVGFISENWPLMRDVLLETISTVVAFVEENWPPIWETVSTILADVVSFVVENWPLIASTITSVMGAVLGIVTAVTALISAVWTKWGDEILLVIKTAFEIVSGIVVTALNLISSIIRTVTDIINGDWDAAWESMKETLGVAWDLIRGIISGAWTAIRLVFSLALSGIKTLLGGTWETIKGGVSTAWDTITGTITGALDGVVSFITALPGRIADAASGMWDSITDGFRGAINTIIDGWNNLSFQLPSIDLGPLGSVGGFTINTPNLPRLASGAALYGETLFIGGDNRNARNDPELVAPASHVEKYVTDAVNEALAPFAGAFETAPKIQIGTINARQSIRRELEDLEAVA